MMDYTFQVTMLATISIKGMTRALADQKLRLALMASERKFGSVCYATPDGSSIRRVVSRVDQPNGIGLSPDGGTLYWAQTGLRQVVQRRIVA